jgi:hypothetical protein
VQLCPPQIPHRLPWDQTWVSGVRGRLLTGALLIADIRATYSAYLFLLFCDYDNYLKMEVQSSLQVPYTILTNALLRTRAAYCLYNQSAILTKCHTTLCLTSYVDLCVSWYADSSSTDQELKISYPVHLSVPWARWIQSKPSGPIPLGSVLVILFHIGICLQEISFR